MNWLTKNAHLGKSRLTSSLGLFALIGAAVLLGLHVRGVNISEKLTSAYSFYFPSSPQQQVYAETGNKVVIPGVKEKPSVTGESPENMDRLKHVQEISGIPRIALHTLNDAQYRQNNTDGSEMAEWVTSQLLSELGNSKQFELLDRSIVPALFVEKSLILVNHYQASTQADLEKLPVSDYTLVGSLFSGDKGKSFSLKLVRNSTGQVLGAARFYFTLDTIDTSIDKARVFIQQVLANSQSISNANTNKRIAFGHFSDISLNDEHLGWGQDITERLIEKYVNKKGYSVLSRTQTFPLLFEEYLRFLQYTEEHRESLRQESRYFVHGKYRINRRNTAQPLSIYLYIDLIHQGRELVVLHAENWDTAYERVQEAIDRFIPDGGSLISAADREASQTLFLKALRTRGMLHYEAILSGKQPPTVNDIQSFSSTYKPENLAATREHIDRSLELNPHNPLTRMALAMYLKTEGNAKASEKILNEVKRGQDASAAELAHQILVNQRYQSESGIGAAHFEPIVGIENAEKIFNQLLELEYLKMSGDRIIVNSEFQSDQVINRTHTLSLTGLDPDTAIQVFETLRSFYYRPGIQVKFVKPRRFRPRDAVKKRSWYQTTYQEKHNTEAILHFDIARTASNIHINDATALSSVGFYREAGLETPERRRINLEVAVDGFASSAYIDTSYLKAMVLLGYSLCQAEIGRCGSGEMIHSWIVDHTRAENLKGRGGMYFNVTKDVEQKDRLIFLAADAVDRVSEANLTDMFGYTLLQEQYFVKKYREKLYALLKSVGKPVPDDALDHVVAAYAGLVRAHCTQLSKRKIDLRYRDKYVPSMNHIAKFVAQNNGAAGLLRMHLADIEADYPDVYPYLILQAADDTPFIIEEQSGVIGRVASGDIVPYEPSEIMEIALQRFQSRVNAGELETAKQYIQNVIDYYGITEETAMDLSYMYLRIGDVAMSGKLLNDYGKKSFALRNYSMSNVNGDYAHSGFDEKGRLRFVNKNNPDVYIVYQALHTHIGLAEQPVKWRLYSSKKSHSGNRNPMHPELFAFGNGGRLAGERVWTSQVLVGRDTNRPETGGVPDVGGVALTEVAAVSESELGLPENGLERMFMQGYAVSADQRTAIKGFPNKPSVGPLQDAHFSDLFARNRKLRVVKEVLFEKGYLSVSRIPVLHSRNALHKKLADDFPDYSELERRNLHQALTAAGKVPGAGYVEIVEDDGGAWKQTSTLIADDAVDNRHFGLAVASHGDSALVCDYKDGLYSYLKSEDKWLVKTRIESRCGNVVMNGEWAVVASTQKVFVYRNNNGLWEKTQTLLPDNYLQRLETRHRFTYFGSALAIVKDTIMIGNPYGGAASNGEVYIFTLSDGKWRQSNVLLSGKAASGFGKSIAADDDFLVIGDPATGGVDTPVAHSGSVFLYARDDSAWKLKAHLVPEGRPKNARFGTRAILKAGSNPSLLIQSAKHIYRYNLSSQVPSQAGISR